MAVEGTLDLFQLPEILQLISQQQKTGILTVQGQNDIVAISFLAGRIVAADALNQTMEEGLTRVLVAEGMLTQQELARAMAEHPSAGGRLIDFLVERRYVTRQRLLAALRLQTYSLIEQLLRWDQGDFKFYSGEEVSYEEAFVPITVEELLLNAGNASARPAAEAAPAPHPARPVAPPPLRAVPRPEPIPKPAVPPAAPRTAPASPAVPPLPAARVAEPVPIRRPAVPLSPVPPPSVPAAEPAAPAAFRKMKVEQLAVPLSFRAVARIAALVPAILLVVALLTEPGLVLFPFPWEEGQRQGLAQEQRSAQYLKIDRAAKTFFLLEARFPERLAQLQQLNLLAGNDLRDSQGHELRYSLREESYKVQPVDAKGTPIPGAETTDAVTGNFLLDSDFISLSPDAQAPLVLLD
ncbi:MAG: hypothetical protein QOJ16_2597 [Acidobacteriota bacterium]|jgi:hypothetical protein|nr:hypothetical protein [Acidobacteriota bacterium]